ncbi:MAG: HEAT repeat domain-containing protein [Waterburya sp.]
MELHQIETYLDSRDPQHRMKAITELRNYQPNLAIPLLKRTINDKEFIIRSFVATGLGHKRTDEGFELLLDLIEYDSDYNVRAEAANSLAKYGEDAIPYLVQLFQRDSNWLVRFSIFAAIDSIQYPETILKLSILGLRGENLVVKETVVASLGQLAETPQESRALELLLSVAQSQQAPIRALAAKVLRNFKTPKAETALANLRRDSDYRVVSATLEGLV